MVLISVLAVSSRHSANKNNAKNVKINTKMIIRTDAVMNISEKNIRFDNKFEKRNLPV